jgi:phosphatidylglycerophosphate synthase
MKKNIFPDSIFKSAYFAYWSDLWGFPAAKALLPFVSRIPFISPNKVTVGAFFLHVLGCLSLFIAYPYHFFVAGIALIIAFICDDLDGQLARYTKRTSVIGEYLDKVLDLLKVYILLLALAYAVYLTSHQILPLLLGFTACFFYTFRMYIKYVTMLIAFDKDKMYFDKSAIKRKVLLQDLAHEHANLARSYSRKIRLFILYNRALVFVDEAEIAVFTSIGAFLHRLDISLWVLVISQIAISFFKFFERLIQLKNNSENLLKPMRK